MSGGGGGGSTYYANLERLYGEQADNAAQLRGESQKTFGDLASMRSMAQDYGSEANRERAASTATADFRNAAVRGMQSINDNLASMGINPGDERYARNMRGMETDLMGSGAAAITGARDRVSDKGFAMMSDITNMGLGLPGQATSAFNSAGNMMSSAGNMSVQQQQMASNAAAGAVRGGIDLYGLSRTWAADGGYIHKYKKGGYVQRLARGGIVGAMESTAPAAPPPSMPASASMANQVAGAGARGVMALGRQGVGSAVEGVGNAVGSNAISSYGAGIRLGKDAQGAADAYKAAAQQVNAALPPAAAGAGEGVAAAGATEGAAASAGADLATTAAGLEGGAALGAAMPWIGGAMLVGSALGLFKDGGEVTPFSHAAKGGEVDGPGGPKDDMVPAMLSDGEFVLPVGTVKKYGLAKLEKMRQEGLEFERQLGIGA